jgi:hypothetical protein
LLYFAVQLPLTVAILYAAIGWLYEPDHLPAGQQRLELFRRQFMVAILSASFVAVDAAQNGWPPRSATARRWRPASCSPAPLPISAPARREARPEAERLAAQLQTANHQLREHAAQAEEWPPSASATGWREIHDSLGHYLTVINV